MRQNQIVSYAGTVAFNAATYQSFEITLNGDVTSSSFTGGATGELYSLAITQDSQGSHNFAYPSNFINPIAPNKVALSTTVQLFVLRSDGNYYPTTPGQYN